MEKGLRSLTFVKTRVHPWSVWSRLTTASTGQQQLSALRRRLCARCLSQVDTDTGMAYQIMCRTKGRQDQYVVAGICKFLTDLRCSDIVLQSDGEHPIRAIVAAIAQTAREKRGLVIRERRAPKFSHQSQGSVEATIRHCARCAEHWKMKRGWRFRWHMTLLLGWCDTLGG